MLLALPRYLREGVRVSCEELRTLQITGGVNPDSLQRRCGDDNGAETALMQ